MKTLLTLTELESRDVPALFDPVHYAADFQPIPGWTGPVRVAELDANGDGSVDTAYAAGAGGGPRVVVYSGGRIGEQPVPIPPGTGGPTVNPGEVVVQAAGAGEVIFNGFVYEPEFRGGSDITTVVRPGQPDGLVVTAGPGGGPVVAVYALGADGVFAEVTRFLAFEESYRGGVFAAPTTVAFEVPAEPHRFGTDILVMPLAGGGGGPVVAVFDVTGQEITRFLVGPETDRRGYELLHGDVDVGKPGAGHRGVYLIDADGDTKAFDWRGVEF